MLRRVLIALGIAGLAGGGACILLGLWVPAIYLLAECGVLLAALLLERWRYTRTVNRSTGNWQATAERFIDPTSGRQIEVFYNPETGERDYREKSD